MKNKLLLGAAVLTASALAQTPTPPAASSSPAPGPAATPADSPAPARTTPASRRSTRVVNFTPVEVASPDGQLAFTLLGNPERLMFRVTLGGTTMIEPSAIRFLLDGFDLGSGVVLEKTERGEIDETYPWHGAHRTAVNRAHTATLSFTHDLSMTKFRVEVRAFDDAVAYRIVVPGAAHERRTPEELSEFIVPAGATAWFHDLAGHYEAEYKQMKIDDVPAGQWGAPPMTLQLPGGAGYMALTEANLVDYPGMAFEADGRRGWVVGLGHRQPLNYPYELRYGREEGKRLGAPAAIEGPITTPWRVVIAGRDLNTLVNSDALPNLCPPPSPALTSLTSSPRRMARRACRSTQLGATPRSSASRRRARSKTASASACRPQRCNAHISSAATGSFNGWARARADSSVVASVCRPSRSCQPALRWASTVRRSVRRNRSSSANGPGSPASGSPRKRSSARAHSRTASDRSPARSAAPAAVTSPSMRVTSTSTAPRTSR